MCKFDTGPPREMFIARNKKKKMLNIKSNFICSCFGGNYMLLFCKEFFDLFSSLSVFLNIF